VLALIEAVCFGVLGEEGFGVVAVLFLLLVMVVVVCVNSCDGLKPTGRHGGEGRGKQKSGASYEQYQLGKKGQGRTDAPTSEVGALLLRLIFTGSLPALPDDVCVQQDLLRATEHWMLEPDLSAIVYNQIGRQLSTNTLCSMSQLSEDMHIEVLKMHCNKKWNTLSPEATKHLCMSNWRTIGNGCSSGTPRPDDPSLPVHNNKRARTS
jgi:hypothetical protein